MDSYTYSITNSLRVYVSGLPRRITKVELCTYFQQFGHIANITLFTSEDRVQSKDSGRPLKGYCILAARDWQTFTGILACNRHSLFGRSIYCTTYQEGNRLMRQNRLNNQRRVIFRSVPSHHDIESLRCLIQRHVGKVELLYEFKLSTLQMHDLSKDKQNNCKAFSVMFMDRSCAEFLIQAGSVAIKGTIFNVEKFKPAAKSNDSTSRQPPNSGGYGECDLLLNKQIDTTTDKNTNSSSPHWNIDSYESIRPTCKLYYEKRSQMPPTLQKLENKYRLNKLRSSWQHFQY